MVRKAIENTYLGVCDIYEFEKAIKSNMSTGFSEVIIKKDEPCKLSFYSIGDANKNSMASEVNQTAKLTISPELKIKSGSKIVIRQNGVTGTFSNTGEPAIYSTHQEIVLRLIDKWA